MSAPDNVIDYNGSRNAINFGVGRHERFDRRSSPARFQNTASTSRFILRFVVNENYPERSGLGLDEERRPAPDNAQLQINEVELSRFAAAPNEPLPC